MYNLICDKTIQKERVFIKVTKPACQPDGSRYISNLTKSLWQGILCLCKEQERLSSAILSILERERPHSHALYPFKTDQGVSKGDFSLGQVQRDLKTTGKRKCQDPKIEGGKSSMMGQKSFTPKLFHSLFLGK